MTSKSTTRTANHIRILPLVAAVTLCLSGTGYGATLVVNNPSGASVAGKCSIVDAANSINLGAQPAKSRCTNTGAAFGINDTITFSKNFTISFAKPGAGTSSALRLTKPVTISGSTDFAGQPLVTIARSATATTAFRLIESDSDLTLNGIMVTGGNVAGDGGGVSVSGSGSLHLSNSAISGNAASGRGGGAFVGDAGATLSRSTLSGNTAESAGGGIYTYVGQVTMEKSTVSGNSSRELGGGMAVGSVMSTGSTISNNSSAIGGGIYSIMPSRLADTTVSGNSAGAAGGGVYASGNIAITFSTISGNSVGANGAGAGIVLFFDGNSVTATILSGNSGGHDVDGPYQARLAGDHNIVGTSGRNIGVPSDTLFCDPHLASLMNDGGPTFTQPPMASSCAINAGPATAALATDQRGMPRVYGSQADVGAVEKQGANDLPY